MISRENTQRLELRSNVCGGRGNAAVKHIIEDESLTSARMIVRITVDPGSSFGRHMHHNETEIYYVLSGEIVTESDGREYTLRAGDASMTSDGEIHFLENRTAQPAELIAVIIGKGYAEEV